MDVLMAQTFFCCFSFKVYSFLLIVVNLYILPHTYELHMNEDPFFKKFNRFFIFHSLHKRRLGGTRMPRLPSPEGRKMHLLPPLPFQKYQKPKVRFRSSSHIRRRFESWNSLTDPPETLAASIALIISVAPSPTTQAP